MENDKVAEEKKKRKKARTQYIVELRGTRFLPRRNEVIFADNIRRNRFGDLILTQKCKTKQGKIYHQVVGSYNRESLFKVVLRKNLSNRKIKDKSETK